MTRERDQDLFFLPTQKSFFRLVSPTNVLEQIHPFLLPEVLGLWFSQGQRGLLPSP